MTLPFTWGDLQKDATNTQTIQEAIIEAVNNHLDDQEAHLGENGSLRNHKINEIIDHPEQSIVEDKRNTNLEKKIILDLLSSIQDQENWSISKSLSGFKMRNTTGIIELGWGFWINLFTETPLPQNQKHAVFFDFTLTTPNTNGAFNYIFYTDATSYSIKMRIEYNKTAKTFNMIFFEGIRYDETEIGRIEDIAYSLGQKETIEIIIFGDKIRLKTINGNINGTLTSISPTDNRTFQNMEFEIENLENSNTQVFLSNMYTVQNYQIEDF